MSFDKSKAMRNAERHVAQGKIRLAIGEYKQVVEHDPRDFGTLNMLGDLFAKESDKREAVRCYKLVAEHYSKQGFAQKAIAIYNKIARLEPDSVDVSEKLAELYKLKGSLSEAKSHYTTLAEHYLSKGRHAEARAIWKQIGMLDPNNTSVFLRLAEGYREDEQADEAVEAYGEAASRFSRAARHAEAADAFSRALELKPGDLNCLNGLIREKKTLGHADEAIDDLKGMLDKNPNNRDIARLLVDYYVECQQPEEAEKALIKLVEQEPANYAKLLDLTHIYLKRNDTKSAARVFSMCSEHLLMAGKAEEFTKWLDEILKLEPNELNALRLSARFSSWKRDKDGLRWALEKMAQAAKDAESIDDERYALSQLTMIAPHELSFSERLSEINAKYGFHENLFDETILQEQFAEESLGDVSGSEPTTGTVDASAAVIEGNGFEIPAVDANGNGNGSGKRRSKTKNKRKNSDGEPTDELVAEFDEGLTGENSGEVTATIVNSPNGEVPPTSADVEVEKEIESVRFYIENGYLDLAEKTITELRERFGERPEFNRLENLLGSGVNSGEPQKASEPSTAAVEPEVPLSKSLDISEIRSEFGLDEIDPIDDTDYETHFQMGAAYQGMGLLEEAIKEYQEAINLISPKDGTRRFFHCANLLGHCFMQNGMAHLALTWYNRALETPDLHEEEKHGIWYELAEAYEADGDQEKAARHYELVYAENVDFRDVSERLKSLAVNA